MDIAGKVALVTGAGSGIGRAIAMRLGREGAAIVVADIEPSTAQETSDAILGVEGRASFVQANVADPADAEAMVRFSEGTFGGLDILVNNAGGVEPPFFPEAPAERWVRVLDVNLKGLMLAMQHGIEAMRRRGGGAIVNVASVAGLGHGPHDAPEYAAAKAAVIRLSEALVTLQTTANIRVNCICPDWVDTPATRRGLARMNTEDRESVPSALVPAEEIADLVIEMIRDDSLAGRVLVRWVDQPAMLLPLGEQ